MPETVSLADLTADSISKDPTKLLEPASDPLVAEYEFQSARSDEDGADNDFGSELEVSSPPPENQFCIFTVLVSNPSVCLFD